MTNINDFKELFLKLTEYTIPFGKEETLEPLLPTGFKRDSIGNYYYEIGQSETLFTTHLDTYSQKYQKINHVIEDNLIATDGKTILGGDNKLGTAILINMVNEKKPGTYFFFLGEEPLGKGGLYGSSNALKSNPEYFKKFKRCIAFDRKEYGSIVTRQMGRNCCSMEFATEIAKNLAKFGIEWNKKVGYGYYTDTAVFMDTIPEVTNLSAGGFKEHHLDEMVDLNYTFNVLKAALGINWESLPVVRELEQIDTKRPQIKKFVHVSQERMLKNLSKVMDIVDLTLTKSKYTELGREVTFSKWLQDYDLKLTLDYKGNIIFEGETFTYDQFIEMIFEGFKEYIKSLVEYHKKEGDFESVNDMFKTFGFKNKKEFLKKLL